jgi:hypothetical protein
MVGGIKTTSQEDRISALFDRLLDNAISDFESNHNIKRG